MTPWGDFEDEMRGLWVDEDTADRLLSGLVEPDDAPPGYVDVARMVRAAGSPATAGELAQEREAVFAAAAAVGARPSASVLRTPRRSKMRPKRYRAKVAGLVLVGTLAGTTGLAAAGALPDPAQDVASDVLARVGITVPAGDDDPASSGSDVSGTATTTDATGVDKGAEISSAASGGMSQAGDHGGQGSAAAGAAPVDTPNDGGTDTADEASDGASKAETDTANESSDGHSEDGSANAGGNP
ncbi:MAG: hypothetical protein ACRDHS_08790 [Actinomycetota bacterium]